MTFVDQVESNQLDVTYSADVDATTFDPNDFLAEPGDIIPGEADQLSPNQLHLVSPDDYNAGGTLTYTGASPGIRSPQTIAY